MNSIDRYKIIESLNTAALNDSVDEVTNLLNTLFNNKGYKEYIDLIYYAISSFQLYGYLAYLSEEEKNEFLDIDLFRTISYKGNQMDYYNRGQLSFVYDLEKHDKVLFSAPTSFGKTSIVIEYIIRNYNKLNNIFFIVPTNSLLEELYMKLIEYNKKYKMGYIISNQPNRIIGKNIFVLTPERFLLILQMVDLKKIDLIIMDEMYKINDSSKKKVSDFVNNRSLRFRRVADIVAASENQVIFLSPFTYTLSKSMKKFINKYNIEKIDRRVEYVKRDIINSSDIIDKNIKTDNAKIIELLNLLDGQQNIVYVKGYDVGYKIIDAYNNPNFSVNSERYFAFCNHIRDNYVLEESNWSISEAIEKGLGMYISPMPRYIKKEIVSLFEQGIIKTMIVTTAFTEGVNTGAKNLIISSMKNGSNSNDLTDIDLLNVMGRVGRFARESIGKVYCISDKIYNKVCELQSNGDCLLENNNYIKEITKSDYEIEMMENEFLTHEEIIKKGRTRLDMQELGLSMQDLHISLSVSNQWKVLLYKYFKELENEKIAEIYEYLQILLKQKKGSFENALSAIFKDIRNALESNGIKAFPVQPYEIPAFDKQGEFIWGRLYRYYATGNIKTTIKNNIRYISDRYKKVVGENVYRNKKDVEQLFKDAECAWILSYYTTRLELKYNKFYSECFRFISNVVQYKIPFYLSFYISIFKLYIEKGNFPYEVSKIQEKDIVILFEEGDVSKEYQSLLDFGIPMTILNKIDEKQIHVHQLKDSYQNMQEFDSYEKMLLGDYFTIYK